MKKTVLTLIITLSFASLPPSALAAKMAKVLVENAKVLEKPQADAKELAQLPKDSSIPVSNNQTNGFFKTKTSSGVIGWVSGNDVLAGETISGTPAAKKEVKETKEPTVPVIRDSVLILSGGLNFLNNSGFPATIPNTDGSTALAGGLEVQLGLGSKFALAGRAEYITKSSTQSFTSGAIDYEQSLSFKTIPLMVGMVYLPVNNDSIRWGLGAYGGVSMLTALTALRTSPSSTEPAGPGYTSSDLTAYFNTSFQYWLASRFGIMLEVGYRLHSATYPEFSESAPTVDAFSPNFGGLVTRFGFAIGL